MSRKVPKEISSARPVASGLFWMFSSQGVLSVLQIAILIILARLLTPLDYGMATVFIAITQVCSIMATFGFGTALIQRPAVEGKHFSAVLTIAFSGGVILGLLLYLLRQPLAAILELDNQTKHFWLFVPMCSVTAANVALRAMAQRERLFQRMSQTETLSYIFFYSIPAVWMALSGYGGMSLLIPYILNFGFNTAVYFRLVRPAVALLPDWDATKDLGRTGIGFGLTELMGVISQNADKILLSSLLGTAAVGIYGRANSLMQTGVNVLSSPLDAVMFPTFSQSQSDPHRMQLLFKKTLILAAILLLPGVLLAVCAPEDVVLTLLGPKWMEVAPLLRVFGALIWIRVNGRAVDFVLRAKGLAYRRLMLMFVFSALTIACILVGSKAGLVGVAIGLTLAYFLHALLVVHIALGQLHERWRWFAMLILQPVLWALPVGLCIVLIDTSQIAASWYPAIKVTAYGVVCGSALTMSIWFKPNIIFGKNGILARDSAADIITPIARKLIGKLDRLAHTSWK